jgi:hypothetical protein
MQKINLHLSDIAHTHTHKAQKLAMLLHHHIINALLISLPTGNVANLTKELYRVPGNMM